MKPLAPMLGLAAAVGVVVSVTRGVSGFVRAGLIRSSLVACSALPEVSARLPAPPAVPGSVAVRLTGDRELRRLNRLFLGVDSVTDVLSFPASSGAAAGAAGAGGLHLGDIAISLPAARRQAVGFGHPLESEVALLSVHGFLHLLGWDHATVVEATEMNRLTLAALASLGLGLAAGRLASSVD